MISPKTVTVTKSLYLHNWTLVPLSRISDYLANDPNSRRLCECHTISCDSGNTSNSSTVCC